MLRRSGFCICAVKPVSDLVWLRAPERAFGKTYRALAERPKRFGYDASGGVQHVSQHFKRHLASSWRRMTAWAIYGPLKLKSGGRPAPIRDLFLGPTGARAEPSSMTLDGAGYVGLALGLSADRKGLHPERPCCPREPEADGVGEQRR